MQIRRFLFVPAFGAAALALSVAAQAQPARWTDNTRTTAGPATTMVERHTSTSAGRLTTTAFVKG